LPSSEDSIQMVTIRLLLMSSLRLSDLLSQLPLPSPLAPLLSRRPRELHPLLEELLLAH